MEAITVPADMASLSKTSYGLIIFFVVCTVALFIADTIMVSTFLGDRDDWIRLKPQITKIWGVTLGGTLALFIVALLFYTQAPDKTMYFILGLTCLSFGLSFSALSLAAISR